MLTKIDILIPNKGPADCPDDTMLTSEKEYYVNFTEQENKFCFRLSYNWMNDYIFVKKVEI